jgi:hypothetical protein
MLVTLQEACQANLSQPTIAVSPYVDLLTLDCLERLLDQDVLLATLSSSSSHLDFLGPQPSHEVSSGEYHPWSEWKICGLGPP